MTLPPSAAGDSSEAVTPAAPVVPKAGQLRIGQLVARRYEITSLIGSGSVGAVYRAFDHQTDGDVAIRVINPRLTPDAKDRARFVRTMHALRSLVHGNVVRYFDAGESGGRCFLAMQLVAGVPLSEVIRSRRESGKGLALEEIGRLCSQLFRAVGEPQSFVHGSLKPADVMILPDLLKVGDFGLVAALPHRAYVNARTAAGLTARYLAPEVRDGYAITHASDVYSVGVIVAELFSGQDFDSAERTEYPQVPSSLAASLRDLLTRATAIDPDQRYGSVLELGAAVRRIVAEAATGASASGSETDKHGVVSNPAGTVSLTSEEAAGQVEEEADSRPAEEERQLLSAGSGEGSSDLRRRPQDGGAQDISGSQRKTGDSARESMALQLQKTSAEPALSGVDRQTPRAQAGAANSGAAGQPCGSPAAGTLPPEEQVTEQLKLDELEFDDGDEPPQSPRPSPERPDDVSSSQLEGARETGGLEPPDSEAGETLLPPPGEEDVTVPRLSIKDDLIEREAREAVVVVDGASLDRQSSAFEVDTSMIVEGRLRSRPLIRASDDEVAVSGETRTPRQERGAESPQPFPHEIKPPGEKDWESRARDALRAFDIGLAAGAGQQAPRPDRAPRSPEVHEVDYQWDAESATVGIGTPGKAADKAEPREAHVLVAPEVLHRDAVPRPLAEEVADRRVGPQMAREHRAGTGRGVRYFALFSVLVALVTIASIALLQYHRRQVARRALIEKRKRFAQTSAAQHEKIGGKQRKIAPARVEPAVQPQEQRLTPPEVPKSESPPEDVPADSARAALNGTTQARCPNGMALVGDPKVSSTYCIDRYEAPGRGKIPTQGVSLGEARKRCRRRGLRLCSAKEWMGACGGLFPYGAKYGKDRCQTETDRVRASGSKENCRSKWGVYDLSGNVDEWVEDGAAMGGDIGAAREDASCVSRGWGGPRTGYRCCTGSRALDTGR